MVWGVFTVSARTALQVVTGHLINQYYLDIILKARRRGCSFARAHRTYCVKVESVPSDFHEIKVTIALIGS